jgi:peptidoglycan biosynthesis protein MviN/MurJ (putative lipid II flippase)
MAENTSYEEKKREESFTEAPKSVNRVTLIATLIVGIIVIIGILFIGGLFSVTDERGNNSNESIMRP